MLGMANRVFNAALAVESAPRESALKPGFPDGDFCASLGFTVLVLVTLVQGGVYLHDLTRRKD